MSEPAPARSAEPAQGRAMTRMAGHTPPLEALLAAAAGPDGCLELACPGGRGRVHLAAGRIAHAEFDGVPALGEMLVGTGVVAASGWQAARRTGAVGPALVARGVPEPDLLAAVEAVTVDALLALARAAAAGAEIGWRPAAGDRLGTRLGWDLAEARRRTAVAAVATAQAAAAGIDGTTVVGPAHWGHSAGLSRAAWALGACLLAPAPVLAHARSAGQPLHVALGAVAELVRTGLCRTVSAEPGEEPTVLGPAVVRPSPVPRPRGDSRPGTAAGVVVPEPRRAEGARAGVRPAADRRSDAWTAPGEARSRRPARRQAQRRSAAAAVPLPATPATDPEGRPFVTPEVPVLLRMIAALTVL